MAIQVNDIQPSFGKLVTNKTGFFLFDWAIFTPSLHLYNLMNLREG